MQKKYVALLGAWVLLAGCHAPSPAPGPAVSTLAGIGRPGFADGAPGEAAFHFPRGLAVDGQGNLYVADTENHRIRRISPDGRTATFAGTGGVAHSDGPAATAQFNSPCGVAFDSDGTLYVADAGNHCIRQIRAGVVSTLAGTVQAGYGTAGFADGPAATARFDNPYGVAVDAQHTVYVADTNNHRIRTVSGGVVRTLAGSGTAGFADGPGAVAQFYGPGDVAVDGSGSVYVADYQTHRIRKVSPTGIVSTFAGSGTPGTRDGVGPAAEFNAPLAVALDAQGTLFVTDGSARVRQITAGGAVRTAAGSGVPGYADGPAASAQFQHPYGLAVDAQGRVYVADQVDNRIRKITLP